MVWRNEKEEVNLVLNRILDSLEATITSQTGRAAAPVKAVIGNVKANYRKMMLELTFADNYLACFTVVREAGVSLNSMVAVHNTLFAESPVGDIASTIVMSGLIFCLASESRMISELEFVSRDDVEQMTKKMKLVFDEARLLAADANDSYPYQKLTALAGSLTNFLATTSRPLPRMVTFQIQSTLPALALSQRVYHEGSRWEELVLENKTIHPAFMQRDIIGLSK